MPSLTSFKKKSDDPSDTSAATISVGSKRLKRRNTLIGWTFILPNFIGFGLLTLIPVLTLFYTGLTKWSALSDPKFIGLQNYDKIMRDKLFWKAVGNTFYFAIFHVPLTLFLALGLAILLNKKLRFRAFFRTASFFPYFTSVVAIAQVWTMLFSPEVGPINIILKAVGMADPPGWFATTSWAMPGIIIIAVWKDMGYYMILYLAGLQTVPQQLYEAATLDGAGKWRQFMSVTWPSLRPTTFFIVIMLTIGSLKILDLVLVTTNGGPGTSTLVLSQYIYRMGFEQNQYGYASAASLILFFICLIVTSIQFYHNRRLEK